MTQYYYCDDHGTVTFYRDERGLARARNGGGRPDCAIFLESDIQCDVESIDLVLADLNEVESGRKPEAQGSWNSHETLIYPDAVVIKCLYDDRPGDRLSHSDFRRLLASWREFLIATRPKK